MTLYWVLRRLGAMVSPEPAPGATYNQNARNCQKVSPLTL